MKIELSSVHTPLWQKVLLGILLLVLFLNYFTHRQINKLQPAKPVREINKQIEQLKQKRYFLESELSQGQLQTNQYQRNFPAPEQMLNIFSRIIAKNIKYFESVTIKPEPPKTNGMITSQVITITFSAPRQKLVELLQCLCKIPFLKNINSFVYRANQTEDIVQGSLAVTIYSITNGQYFYRQPQVRYQSNYEVQGIAITKGEKYAVVNGNLIKTGDYIDRWLVKSINSNQILLKCAGETKVLNYSE